MEGISGLCARAAPNPLEENRRNNHFQTAIPDNEKINLELEENILICHNLISTIHSDNHHSFSQITSVQKAVLC